MGSVIVPFFISQQGCPHQCVFCNQQRISGATGGVPSTAEILARIAYYRESAGNVPVEVAFYGGTFTNIPREVQERLLLPLQPLLASGAVVSVRISTRPDAIGSGVAEFLIGMGVRTVELGVQSMDDEVLSLAGRGHTATHAIDATRTLRRAGLSVGIQLMPGLPGDTAGKALASLDRVLALGPEFLRIYPALVIAGTRLADLYRSGDYQPLPLADAVRICKVMLHRALAADVRVIRIGLQANVELDGGSVLAGPYHPAFRQLVESDICYDLLVKLVASRNAVSPVSVFCAPSRVSDVVGQRRANLLRLSREHGVKVAAVRGDPLLSPMEIVVDQGNGMRKGNMVPDLEYGKGAAH